MRKLRRLLVKLSRRFRIGGRSRLGFVHFFFKSRGFSLLLVAEVWVGIFVK